MIEALNRLRMRVRVLETTDELATQAEEPVDQTTRSSESCLAEGIRNAH